MTEPYRNPNVGNMSAYTVGERAEDGLCEICFGMSPKSISPKLTPFEMDNIPQHADACTRCGLRPRRTV